MEAYDQIKVIQEARKRRRRALRLRESGKTLQEIAEILGLASRQRAAQLVQRAKSDAARAVAPKAAAKRSARSAT